MKFKTLELISEHMGTNNIYFPDNRHVIDYRLTDGQIRDIIGVEYGIRPKKNRIIKKYLKRLGNDLLREVIEDVKWN